MKITNLSLIATLLLGSSAMALDNTKVTGDANVYYQTTSANYFDQGIAGSSSADTSLNLNVTTDIVKNDTVTITAGAGYTVLSTLGLEKHVVGNTWGNAHTVTVNGDGTATVDNVSWINEAWIAATVGNTTVKVGRQALDTPLAYTETWSVEKNTFDASVLINTDLPNTTIVGAYITSGNGTTTDAGDAGTDSTGSAKVVTTGAGFYDYVSPKGVAAIGVINNSIDGLTAQAWYYNAIQVGKLTWVQADLALGDIKLGAQYATTDVTNSNVYAVMAGYTTAGITATLAYSEVDTAGAAGNNTATTSNQSKLYTEANWYFGNVTKAGAKATKLSLSVPTSIADLAFYVTEVDTVLDSGDMTEYTATASKSFGIVDATLLYVSAQNAGLKAAKDDVVQVYLSSSF